MDHCANRWWRQSGGLDSPYDMRRLVEFDGPFNLAAKAFSGISSHGDDGGMYVLRRIGGK